jgi:hypothetical protein
MSAPHLDSRVITPTSAQTSQGAPNLIRLYTLLAKPAIVQDPNRLIKISKGRKGHHLSVCSKNSRVI